MAKRDLGLQSVAVTKRKAAVQGLGMTLIQLRC